MRLWWSAEKKTPKKQEHVKTSRKPASCKKLFSFWKLLRIDVFDQTLWTFNHQGYSDGVFRLDELQPDSLNEAFNTDGGLLCLETQTTSWNQFRFLFKWTDTKCSERPYLLTSLFKMLNHLLHDAQHRFLTVVSFLVHGDIGSICFLNAVSFDFWSLVPFIEPDWKQRPFLFWNPTPGVQVSHCSVPGLQIL